MANIVFIVVCHAESRYIGCCTINEKESRHKLDKCSTVCIVVSGLALQEASITGQRFSFLTTKLSIFALNIQPL